VFPVALTTPTKLYHDPAVIVWVVLKHCTGAEPSMIVKYRWRL